MNAAPEVYWIHVAPRKHTGEAVALLISVAVLFVLLYLMLEHPPLPHHAGAVVPAHASEKR